jgi:hypothetical protein
MTKKERKPQPFDPTSIYTSTPVAARALGAPYSTFMSGEGGMFCISNSRFKVGGGRYVVFTAVVLSHAANVASNRQGKCDGSCVNAGKRVKKWLAEAALRQAPTESAYPM